MLKKSSYFRKPDKPNFTSTMLHLFLPFDFDSKSIQGFQSFYHRLDLNKCKFWLIIKMYLRMGFFIPQHISKPLVFTIVNWSSVPSLILSLFLVVSFHRSRWINNLFPILTNIKLKLTWTFEIIKLEMNNQLEWS